jgi:hypothetical protein
MIGVRVIGSGNKIKFRFIVWFDVNVRAIHGASFKILLGIVVGSKFINTAHVRDIVKFGIGVISGAGARIKIRV